MTINPLLKHIYVALYKIYLYFRTFRLYFNLNYTNLNVFVSIK